MLKSWEKKDIREWVDERVAIMMVDGGLSEEEAQKRVADILANHMEEFDVSIR
jgi:hypothetical protein